MEFFDLLKISWSLSVTTLDARIITLSLSSYFVFKLKSPMELLTIRNKNNQMCEEHVVTFSLKDLNGNYSKSNLATIIIGESKVTIKMIINRFECWG